MLQTIRYFAFTHILIDHSHFLVPLHLILGDVIDYIANEIHTIGKPQASY